MNIQQLKNVPLLHLYVFHDFSYSFSSIHMYIYLFFLYSKRLYALFQIRIRLLNILKHNFNCQTGRQMKKLLPFFIDKNKLVPFSILVEN